MTTKLLKTLPEAAREIGIPVHSLRRAAKRGDIKTYQTFSKRLRVNVPEVMESLRVYNGGDNDL